MPAGFKYYQPDPANTDALSTIPPFKMAASCSTQGAGSQMRQHGAGYLPIENYGLIGNMRTCALVGMDGSVDYMCWPEFDSPSVFCRLLDKDKGGYFSIHPASHLNCTTKQQYLPSSNILQTRYIHEDGVADLVDFFPRPKSSKVIFKGPKQSAYREMTSVQEELKKWLVRRVECIRGHLELDVELFPAFEYATEPHETTIVQETNVAHGSTSKTVTFHSKNVKLQLDVTIDRGEDNDDKYPVVKFKKVMKEGMLGEGVVASIHVHPGQAVSFVLRNDLPNHVTEVISPAVLDTQQHDTQSYWYNWISQSKYKGRWREVVSRSLMILKLMTYEPTGAIIAAPTFSIPEDIGGVRNWDYRFCWVRDASFTIYILLRLGFTEEADAYMDFINERFLQSRVSDGGLPIMFTIRGETDIPERELSHLDGYKGSKPVRVGNGAAFHQQFDIYGELMDAIYLYNKYGKPIHYDAWVTVRQLLDYVLTILDQPDMSIWEVRNNKQNFTYSKIMLWVAFDRGLRLAEKRNFPCPNRWKWLEAKDKLYEEIMERGYNKEMKCFVQSYENNTMLDSSILIAPLVFFIAPNDPRFLNTLDRIMLPPEKGGLTSTGLVYRYDTELSEDGVGGREGAFSMCTFWLVEAMTRASVYEPKYLVRAINLFENMLSFSNHLMMFSEEISRSGEQLGNTPQAFSHLALISAAFNLDRVSEFKR
ncbi:Putative Glycoside Hydrolase Family 15 [Podospora comata]|uniref:Glycoside Hydrolase Family 15 n=1 Tax=Podospora comata TaxID=48703 RepID=A0ABY6RWJ7_PODCO|nr:Putative Glycoside Hydrolase Family 15 [Podospora comata]